MSHFYIFETLKKPHETLRNVAETLVNTFININSYFCIVENFTNIIKNNTMRYTITKLSLRQVLTCIYSWNKRYKDTERQQNCRHKKSWDINKTTL